MVTALGGPANLVERPWDHLVHAALVREVHADRAGVVTSIDTRQVGLAVVVLGGGRRRPQDPIDHAVGLTRIVGVGDAVSADRPLAVVHAQTEAAIDEAAAMLRAAIVVGDQPPPAVPVVLDRVVLGG
jgi:thymidine phosphorylase